MRDFEAWAEFGDVLRLPVGEDDVVSRIPWEQARMQPALPLLDIGCGSGLSTVAMGRRHPDAEIVAVEPDWLMRSLLMLRVAERDDLRGRTTVLPEPIGDCWLPDECGGALLFNVIYFLGEREREELWWRMAQVLAPDAPVLVSRSYGAGGGQVERKLSASQTLGRHEYQRWFSASSLPDGRVELVNTYLTLRDGQVVREEVTRTTAYGLSEDTVVDEIPVGHFGIEEVDEDYLVVRRLPDIVR